MRRKHLAGLFFLLFLAGCLTGSPEKVATFQFQPDAGKVYQVDIHTVSTSKSSFGVTGDTTSFRFDIAPVNADSTGTRVVVIFRALRQMKKHSNIKVTSTSITKFTETMIKFRSDQRRIMDALAGDSLTLFINTQGQLLLEDGLDLLIRNVSQRTKLDQTEVKLTVRDFLSPAAIGDLMTALFFYLPVKSIRPGDSWVKNTMLLAHAPIKHSNMITVDTIQKGVVHLTVKSRISAGGEGNIYMDGTRIGSVDADRSSGFPLHASFTDETLTRTSAGEISRTSYVNINCTIR